MTLAKAVLAEYFCMTLFLFFTIGTISSNCHAGDIAAASGTSKTLTSSEHLNRTPPKLPFNVLLPVGRLGGVARGHSTGSWLRILPSKAPLVQRMSVRAGTAKLCAVAPHCNAFVA